MTTRISHTTETFNLLNGDSLDLFAGQGANDTVNVSGPFSAVSATFNLMSRAGHVAINLYAGFSNVTGNMQVNGGTVDMEGGSHNYWIPTGVYRVTNGADVKLAAQIQASGGGTFAVSGGAKLEFLSWARPQSETVLSGGIVNYGLNIGGTVTFAQAAGSEFDIHTDPGVASYTMDANDLLTLFDDGGNALGAVTVHDQTAQAIQVDKTSFGVAIVADNVPRPGMLVAGVA